jgi:hypothetical protein
MRVESRDVGFLACGQKKKKSFSIFEEGGVKMCKKLIILCLALVVVGLSVPALAVYIGFDEDGMPNGCANPLKVDIDGSGTVTKKCSTQPWQGWTFSQVWSGPLTQQFANPLAEKAWEYPKASLEAYRAVTLPSNEGQSRNRSGGFAAVMGTNEYSPTAKGLGTSYIKLTLTQLKPSTEYKLNLWSYEASNVWSASSSNPNSKYGCWSTTNPVAWLNDNGWGLGGSHHAGDPCAATTQGYGPIQPVPSCLSGDSNMPAGLAELVLPCGAEGDRVFLMAPDGSDYLGTSKFVATFNVTTNSDGAVAVYGWLDCTDWSGSMHMPLNGFMVTPEPATVALLGLGGLALLRRKRA